MSKVYVVRAGDTLTRIARQHGFADWRTIYNHPDNATFRAKRPNPDRIFPGDQLVIPGAAVDRDVPPIIPVVHFDTPPPLVETPPPQVFLVPNSQIFFTLPKEEEAKGGFDTSGQTAVIPSQSRPFVTPWLMLPEQGVNGLPGERRVDLRFLSAAHRRELEGAIGIEASPGLTVRADEQRQATAPPHVSPLVVRSRGFQPVDQFVRAFISRDPAPPTPNVTAPTNAKTIVADMTVSIKRGLSVPYLFITPVRIAGRTFPDNKVVANHQTFARDKYLGNANILINFQGLTQPVDWERRQSQDVRENELIPFHQSLMSRGTIPRGRVPVFYLPGRLFESGTGQQINGVAQEYPEHGGGAFIALSAQATDRSSLAHEIGHLLGLDKNDREHRSSRQQPTNIMFRRPTPEGRQFFYRDQIDTLHHNNHANTTV